MVKNFDHVTIVVRDVERAKEFFRLLGFEHDHTVIISGKTFSDYMGVSGIEAEHVTLVLVGAHPRTEVQLLRYLHPEPISDPNIRELNKLGFNHVCFAVEDVEEALRRIRQAGIETRNEIMDFYGRKLVFIRGPEGITVELSEWHAASAGTFQTLPSTRRA